MGIDSTGARYRSELIRLAGAALEPGPSPARPSSRRGLAAERAASAAEAGQRGGFAGYGDLNVFVPLRTHPTTDKAQPPPPPSLPYKVDTSRPSLRTNWTRTKWTRLVHPSVP